jgi:hypothetical protein
MAGGHPAIHAAGRLGAQLAFWKRSIDFPEITDPFIYRPPFGQLAIMFHEPRGFSHVRYP